MIITTADAPAAIGPYVQGVNLGAMTITSGQLPINPQDEVALFHGMVETALRRI